MLIAARNSQDLALLGPRHRESTREVRFRLRRIWLRRQQRNFASNAIDFGLEHRGPGQQVNDRFICPFVKRKLVLAPQLRKTPKPARGQN
jgi:hypothetical protein